MNINGMTTNSEQEIYNQIQKCLWM